MQRELEASKKSFDTNLEARYQLCNLMVGKSYNCSESADESRYTSKVVVRGVVICVVGVGVGGIAAAGVVEDTSEATIREVVECTTGVAVGGMAVAGVVEDEVESDEGELNCNDDIPAGGG